MSFFGIRNNERVNGVVSRSVLVRNGIHYGSKVVAITSHFSRERKTAVFRRFGYRAVLYGTENVTGDSVRNGVHPEGVSTKRSTVWGAVC